MDETIEFPLKGNKGINSLDMAYCLIENYDYGTVPHELYKKAVQFALDYLKKKYGKDDYRFRILFAATFGEGNWEDTFKIRCLVHVELIGCPHKTLKECEKFKSAFQIRAEMECAEKYHMKPQKCQHCSYLEGLKADFERMK